MSAVMLNTGNQQQQLQVNNTNDDDTELNFSTFAELCRFCSVKNGPAKIHLFDKEAEQRNLVYKVRSLLPANVS